LSIASLTKPSMDCAIFSAPYPLTAMTRAIAPPDCAADGYFGRFQLFGRIQASVFLLLEF
jgi:hypothetical protein